MQKQQAEYKVNLIGERDLRQLSKEELELMVTSHIQELNNFLPLPKNCNFRGETRNQ